MTSAAEMSFQTKAAEKALSSEMSDQADRSGSRRTSFSSAHRVLRIYFGLGSSWSLELGISLVFVIWPLVIAPLFTRFAHIPSHVSK
jgi:hypothetical protein